MTDDRVRIKITTEHRGPQALEHEVTLAYTVQEWNALTEQARQDTINAREIDRIRVHADESKYAATTEVFSPPPRIGNVDVVLWEHAPFITAFITSRVPLSPLSGDVLWGDDTAIEVTLDDSCTYSLIGCHAKNLPDHVRNESYELMIKVIEVLQDGDINAIRRMARYRMMLADDKCSVIQNPNYGGTGYGE